MGIAMVKVNNKVQILSNGQDKHILKNNQSGGKNIPPEK